MNAVTDHLEPTQPLQNAVLVLIFSALIASGWLTWLPLGVVIAALTLPFLIRRNAKTQMFAPWASVYAGASAFLILPLNFSNLLERLSWMALGVGLAFLVGLAFDGVRERNHLAWLAGLLMLILNPSPAGVIGVLGLSVLGALGTRSSRIRIGIQYQTRSGVIVLVVVGCTLAALSVLLARPTDFHFESAIGSKPNSQNISKPKISGVAMPEASRRSRSRTAKTQTDDAKIQTMLLLTNFALLIVMSSLILAMLRNRLTTARGRRKPDLSELIPLFAAFIIVMALFLLSSNAGSGNGKSPASETLNASQNASREKSEDKPEPKLEKSARRNPILTIIMLLIVLAAAYYAYRITREKPGDLPPEELDSSSDSSLTTQIAATNRVRQAYRAFLELCKTQGIRRSNDQTSLEFAVLVGALFPTSSHDVLVLTKLYEPVRYGQLSDEPGALEAEGIVKGLNLMLKPPPKGEPR